MLIASLLLLLLFVLPLWRITLEAPQYPNGISMYIWINKITGDSEYTLQNINILNHYIGMKYIEPDSIPELKYFPFVVGLMSFIGLFAAWASNRWFRIAWVVLLILLSGLGVYDFYLWEYDYGHNLSPTAPIKVPGMVYQPPLFGSKMLLNFNAASYPHWGGIALMASILVGLLAIWLERSVKGLSTVVSKPSYAIVLSLFLCLSCTSEPQPIDYGHEACHFCMMTIVDTRFGAEAITDKGKIYKFDATECMLNFIHSQPDYGPFRVLVTDYSNPEILVEANQCTFLINSDISSPMGKYLTAHLRDKSARRHQMDHGGEVLNWNQLKAHFDSIALIN